MNGGDGNDVLVGTDGNDVQRGGAGNDDVSGARGNDDMAGDEGDDILRWNPGEGTDKFEGGAGNDIARTTAARRRSTSSCRQRPAGHRHARQRRAVLPRHRHDRDARSQHGGGDDGVESRTASAR